MVKLYIAETQEHFYRYAHDNNIEITPRINVVVPTRLNSIEKIMGLELSQHDIVVIDDCSMPFSFWQVLQARIVK